MKPIILFLITLLALTGCMSKELMQLASKYSSNVLAMDKLQEQFRHILSDCNYEKECFDKELDFYINGHICTETAFKQYGFISPTECEKASKEAARQVAQYIAGGELCKKELETLYKREDDTQEAKDDLNEAKREYDRIMGSSSSSVEDKEKAWEEYQDRKEDLDNAWDDYNKAFKEYQRCNKN